MGRFSSDGPSISLDLNGVQLDGMDLRGAILSGVMLGGAYLRKADLTGANLSHSILSLTQFHDTNLCRADLSHSIINNASFVRANLQTASLNRSNLSKADLSGADFSGANLNDAHLAGATLIGANLSNADLRGAHLDDSILTSALLSGANLNEAWAGRTNFTGVDFSEAKGLETVKHLMPSEISISTIHKSSGKIPEVFLRGCGLSDWQIESVKLYQPDLSNEDLTNTLYRIHDLRAHRAIQISPLFISYSHADAPFVDELEKRLNEKGVRFWRDIHHATAGRLETQIDRAIRLNPTVLLILSEHSVESDWVQHEARLARELERETKRDVLCPVALDDSWKDCRWPKRLREQITEYNILDFSGWGDDDGFRRTFGRLLDGLDLFYK